MSNDAVQIMIASLSQNTLKQYNSCLRQWWQFCQLNEIDALEASIPKIVSYLTSVYAKGASYQTLNCHRSALSLIIGTHIGTDDRVKRWFKGIFKLRPTRPKYDSTWDPQCVLSYVKQWYPLDSLVLEKLTKKLAILLALATGQRIQTLFSIHTKNILISNDRVEIVITDILKTSAPGNSGLKISLECFVNQPEICPVKTLLQYLQATSQLRVGEDSLNYLFITFKRPHKKASCQSISRWIREVMRESGIDTSKFSSHSTRHAAASRAHRVGLTVDSILKAVGWSTRSSTFARHYNRPLQSDSDQIMFARAVCGT